MIFNLFGEAESEKDFDAQYQEYIHSAKWRLKREQKLRQANYVCEHCGISRYSKKLEVHHLTYEHFQHEPLTDLIVLCPDCHKLADRKREWDVLAEQRKKRLEAGFDGWLNKRYGEGADGLSSGDMEYEKEKFYNWLERKAD
jgi:5-methylcytosine-specific restriction endonuclease McrA